MATKKVFIAGHNGMVGSAILRRVVGNPSLQIQPIIKNRRDLDLMDQNAVYQFFKSQSIDCVILAAAKVGGILANNNFPADFIVNNTLIQINVINGAFQAGIRNLLFLGSSCIYPKNAIQPMQESELLSGYLEPTNEPYAVAKILGIKACESFNRQYDTDYRSIMPTNLYGINDNFDELNSHVIPALIRKFHIAKRTNLSEVTLWGTGNAQREFLYVDDLADACLHLISIPKKEYLSLTSPQQSHLNVGTGEEFSISELALEISKVVGYEGKINYDSSKPDGPMRKSICSKKLLSSGWEPRWDLKSGLNETYTWFLENEKKLL
jgi:GDP-L-fucose synthase